MISSSQCRAARALLNWSQPDLATRCDMHVQTISNFESDNSTPSKTTLSKITNILEQAGIAFLDDDGVRRRQLAVQQYQGSEGFRAFMDDIYQTLKDKGGDMCLLNARPDFWLKWLGKEWYETVHIPRMEALLDKIDFRVTIREGDYNFIGNRFGEYRWIPEKIWDDNSFYSYGDKIGFLSFDNNTVEILVLHQKKFAENYRFLFNLVWDQYSIIPNADDYKPKKKTPNR